jgi:hypothetical protein
VLHEFTEEIQKFLSTEDKRRLRQINRKIEGLSSAIKHMQDNIELYEKDLSALDHEGGTLYYKARAKLERACPHDDVKGPYECARDDCSGGHYSCRKCGATVHPNANVKGKRYLSTDEVYPPPPKNKK